MSSATSTNLRLKPDTTELDDGSVRIQPDKTPGLRTDHGLQAWQFFTLAALACATVGVWLVRGQGVLPVVLLSAMMAATALVGFAALRTVRPLVAPDEDRTSMVGHRTRVALEREKALTLRSIKELEFDHAMGKLSDSDWQEMSGRLRARAAGLMRQLEAGGGYREQIERDLLKRLGDAPAPKESAHTCGSCHTLNEVDARFCKACGQRL